MWHCKAEPDCGRDHGLSFEIRIMQTVTTKTKAKRCTDRVTDERPLRAKRDDQEDVNSGRKRVPDKRTGQIAQLSPYVVDD